MNNRVKCIMLIDDDENDNYFHEREIKKAEPESVVIVATSGKDGLNYLKSEKYIKGMKPDLIFLDINMPGMNGWEFLMEYGCLDKELHHSAVIIMLSSSANPDDMEKLKSNGAASDYVIKPLTKNILESIVKKHL
jgi:CheY-like chemotaxis protein